MTAMITTQALQRRLDTRTKPQGALGALEALALQLGLVLQTETPVLRAHALFVFAADHGIAADAVSAYPQAVTGQMLENYRNEGAAINVLAHQHGRGRLSQRKRVLVAQRRGHQLLPELLLELSRRGLWPALARLDPSDVLPASPEAQNEDLGERRPARRRGFGHTPETLRPCVG